MGTNIHLLYVPTLTCNLNCSYCYLGEQTFDTDLKQDISRAESTLAYALNKLENESILAFNLSLHGGEVTTLPPFVLEGLFTQINNYYMRHFDDIQALGQKKSNPHIKTNLFKFEPFYKLFEKHKVSISASIDLPLRLHGDHRVTHQGRSWLDKTLDNLRLLAQYPHNKKISATVSMEHLVHTDEIIEDIKYIHNDIGFDMNQFNIMYAFPSELNTVKQAGTILTPADEDAQLAFYNRLNLEFKDSDLRDGLFRNWFDEFTPSYCTNSMNCGERFYLLQSDGSVYSCVRGQGLSEFYYGNIFEDSFGAIMTKGAAKIKNIHSTYGLHSDCSACNHLSMCNSGCAVVKYNTRQSKSYTCKLQKQIYSDYPRTYPVVSVDSQQGYLLHYMQHIHSDLYIRTISETSVVNSDFIMANDVFDEKNTLANIVAQEAGLKSIFDSQLYTIEHGPKQFTLESQLFKQKRSFHVINFEDSLNLHFPKSLMLDQCSDPIRNTLYLQLLRDTPVIYGDEQRTKQEHIFTYQLYTPSLSDSTLLGSDYYMFDLRNLFSIHQTMFKHGVLNNLFITTHFLRELHYNKQKNNAFYHIQTLNLPFQNVEFYYLSEK